MKLFQLLFTVVMFFVVTGPCNFETLDQCGYTDVSTGSLAWSRQRGVGGLIPSGDHTTGSGQF